MRKAWILMAALAACATAQAMGRKPPLTGILWDSNVKHDLATGKKEILLKNTPPWIYDHSIMSPDGKQLLIRVVMTDEHGRELITDLRTLDMETKKERVWYRGSDVGIYGWSPDGHFIITEGMAPDYVALIIDIQTEEAWLAKIPKGLTRLGTPAWSSDGKSLYASRIDGPKQDQGLWIMKMDLNGGNLRELVHLPIVGGAVLSPDEKNVAFIPIPKQDLFFVDVATGKIHPTKHTPAAEIGASWSPNSKWVSVRQDTSDIMAANNYYAINAETGEWRFLFKLRGEILSWWQPPTGPLPDCGKIVREQLGPGRPLEEVAAKLVVPGAKSGKAPAPSAH